MTISAQVIGTIVEWIDDNLNQPLRIDDIARHARGIQVKTCSAFMRYESLGRYVRERKLKLAARDATPTRKVQYGIILQCSKYGFGSRSKPLRAFYTRTQACRRAALIVKSMWPYALKCLIGQRKPAPPDKANNIIFQRAGSLGNHKQNNKEV